MKKSYLVLVLVALIIIGLGYILVYNGDNNEYNNSSNNSSKENITEPVDLYDCIVDSDCIRVIDGCCSCGNAGKATTINKKYEKNWYEKINKCNSQLCLTEVSNDPTCYAPVKCINNKCAFDFEQLTNN